jgi:hypothetical protein
MAVREAPGVSVPDFGRDRRYPIVNRFRDAGLRSKRPTRIASRKSA